MDAGIALLSFMRGRISPGAGLASIERSRQQRFSYGELAKRRQWRNLSSASLGDIQSCVGSASRVAAALDEARTFRADTLASVRVLRSAVIATGATNGLAGDGRPGPLGGIWSVVDRMSFPRGIGLFAFSAAEELLRAQSSALQHFARAAMNEAVSDARGSAEMPRLMARSWSVSTFDTLSQSLNSCRNALHSHQKKIYVSIFSSPEVRTTPFAELIEAVSSMLPEVVHIQSVVHLLMSQRPAKADATLSSRLDSLAVDAATLERELIASHLAALVGWFDAKGMNLNPQAMLGFGRAETAAFGGRIDPGKRVTIDRLGRLPDGMFVRVLGTVVRTNFVQRKKSGRFVGVIRDSATGAEIGIVAKADLMSSGLRPGCRARVSAFYRKTGSSLHRGEHLEIEELDLTQIYSRDIWKVAFLDLAAPYFDQWPSGMHIAFQPSVETPGSEPSEITLGPASVALAAPCAAEFKEYLKAAKAYDNAISDVNEKGLAASIAAFFMYIQCALADLTVGANSAACAAAVAADLAALDALNSSIERADDAKAELNAAQQDWHDCAYPPPPGSGSTGSTGSSGGGELTQDEEIPDWVLNWEGDEDWGWEPPQPPGPPDPSFSFPDDPPPPPNPPNSSLLV